jgi:site-specific DNA-cytosine methylase
MKIAVLFDGAGLARLGLEQAGHECTGYELDPSKHYLSKFVGSGNSILGDVRDFDYSGYDAIWASPPCQKHSEQNTSGNVRKPILGDGSLLDWSLELKCIYPDKTIWVENVINKNTVIWGTMYNAAQFLENPIQSRRRMIGGSFKEPTVYRKFQYSYPKLKICPAILASEGRAAFNNAKDKRKTCFNKTARYYGRQLTLEECSYHQGFIIPDEWFIKPTWFKESDYQWEQNLYEAIGNGVPVYMAKAFGEVYR